MVGCVCPGLVPEAHCGDCPVSVQLISIVNRAGSPGVIEEGTTLVVTVPLTVPKVPFPENVSVPDPATGRRSASPEAGRAPAIEATTAAPTQAQTATRASRRPSLPLDSPQRGPTLRAIRSRFKAPGRAFSGPQEAV